jgi:hypothetical protein
VFSGAAAETLRRFFADDRAETSFTHPPLFGVTRSWKSFTEIETEVVNARVWAGIHFRTADEKGTPLWVGRSASTSCGRSCCR